MEKIVILDGHAVNPGDLSWDPIRQLGLLTVYDRTAPDVFYERAKDAGILITNKVPFTRERIDLLPRLRYIGVLATGYNIIDTDYARQKGITVTNIPAYSTDGVAQMVFAHLLAIINRVEHYTQQNRELRWTRNTDFCYWDTPITELAGKTIGIIGLGHIGMKVAHIAQAFGMQVNAYTSKEAAQLPDGIQKVPLEKLLADSHIVTLHCPLTDDTHELINRHTLAQMHPQAILINTGRGPLVNEADVAEALATGQLAAYGTDVLGQEPPSADNPLLRQPRAFITPHIAWAASETRQRLINITADNLRAFLEHHPQNVVNS